MSKIVEVEVKVGESGYNGILRRMFTLFLPPSSLSLSIKIVLICDRALSIYKLPNGLVYDFQNNVETWASTYVTWSWKPEWISKKINDTHTHTQKGYGQERDMHSDKRAFHNKTKP